MDEDQIPTEIVPQQGPKKTLDDRLRVVKRTLFTRAGLLGDYDYAYLFTPTLPFMKRPVQAAPFFGLNDRVPVFLTLLLGLQHSLAMLAGIITPAMIVAGSSGANLSADMTQYLVSTSLIVSGFLSAIQIARFHIYKTP